MSDALRTISPDLASLAEAFDRIRGRMQELGANASLWDAGCRCAQEVTGCPAFCSAVLEACLRRGGTPEEVSCRKAARAMAHQAMAEAKLRIGRSELGCCLVAVPVRRRRRLAGAAVACYPPRELQDEERLSRICDRLGMDRQIMAPLAQEACRRGREDGACVGQVLEWTLQDQQALGVAGAELATLSNNLANTYEELSLVYKISGSIRVTGEPRGFLQMACNELLEVMNLEGAAAAVYSEHLGERLDLVVTAGQMGLDNTQIDRLVLEVLAPRFARRGRGHVDNSFTGPPDGGLGTHIRRLVAVPLVAEDIRIGMLVGINKRGGEFDSVDMKLISSIGDQAAVFLRNNRLYADLQDLLMGVLHALTASIDAKDPYTCGHSRRVARISQRLAKACGFSAERAEQIYLAGLLHDIGKIGVPEKILRKGGRLTVAEYEVIKRHPIIGASILGGIRQLKNMIVAIQTHHERPDGAGYPYGIAGTDVPIEGLILGLADAFDAMTSDRTYRKGLSQKAAVEEIRKYTGTQFDERVVEAFLSIDLPGFLEKLSGELAAEPTVLPYERWREEKAWT